MAPHRLSASTLALPICCTCGVQHGKAGATEEHCPVCEDERQYVGWAGQRWTSLAQLHDEGYSVVVREEVPGLWGVAPEPSLAIGQRALLVPGAGGNVLWDCVPYVDEAGVAAVQERGGVAAIALSHPHFYGSMAAWSEAFGGAPIYVHQADRRWVRAEGNLVYWQGDTVEVLPGRTLVNCGTHFAGGTVLHWAEGAGGRGALCTSDVLMVVMDRRFLSFMYSYPNLIPEPPAVIERAARRVEPFAFDAIYGGWWGRVIPTDAKGALDRSVRRYLDHAGHPGGGDR